MILKKCSDSPVCRRGVTVSRILFVLALAFATMQMLVSKPMMTYDVPSGDKIMHAAAFFVFGMLARFSFPDTRYIVPAAWLALYGVAIEVVQFFLSFRSFSLLDIAADIGGLATFGVVASLVHMAVKRKFPYFFAM